MDTEYTAMYYRITQLSKTSYTKTEYPTHFPIYRIYNAMKHMIYFIMDSNI